MKSLLIVEDEKLIRQGIRTMAERSNVPIGEIYEANNGEAALEILRNNSIDVMFTDIRMPRMDGIELVQHLAELSDPPYVVAISGFDDFSYAVEMLRNGATEYLLKPVERDKIREVLEDLEKRITENAEAFQSAAYEKLLQEEYYAAVFPETADHLMERSLIRIPGVMRAVGVLLSREQLAECMEEYEDVPAGISRLHRGKEELKTALEEAGEARKRAFCLETMVLSEKPVPHVPEKLLEQAMELISDTKRIQRIQILATEKQKELIQKWGSIFEEARRGILSPELFLEEIHQGMHEIRKIYKHVLGREEEEKSRILEGALFYFDISEYEEEVLHFLIRLNQRMQQQNEEKPAQKKMNQAIDYIREHYAEDMNMATVSNYVSMNYTLFSYSFKEFTGQNFVSFLKEIRLKAARELLENTDEKIIDIAHQVGYDNEKHFLKTFKGEFGITPSEYRRNSTKK